MKKTVFDPICGCLEDFYNSNSHEILRNRDEEFAFVTVPIASYFNTNPKPTKAFEILSIAFAKSEERFRDLCQDQGFDDLMAILRRAPIQFMGGANWLTYLSLGLVKYTNPNLNKPRGVLVANSTHALVYAWTRETLFVADRIATLANILDTIVIVMRLVGKGAKFRPTAINPLQYEMDSETTLAVDSYEARRPQGLFRDQGLIAQDTKDIFEINVGEIFVFCFARSRIGSQIMLYEPRQELTLNVNFMPSLFRWKPVLYILESYREAITDLFNVRVEAIAQVLYTLSINVFNTLNLPEKIDIVKSTGEIKLQLQPSDFSEEFQHKLDFTFSLLRKGYIRFSREHWIKSLSAIPTPWAPEESQRRELVEEFFNGLAVTCEKCAVMDLSRLRTYPLLYKAPSDEFYMDLSGIGDFLRDLIERAKDWFSSQHGDRFTLSVKTMIEKHVPSVKVIGVKMLVRNEHGGKTECDLIVSAKKKVFVIECKAHAKSSFFFRGDPAVVQQRSSQLTKDLKQAKAAANAFSNECQLPDSPVHGAWDVEFCVCTPSQEFIRPISKFGWIVPDVPRICTPEELIKALQGVVGCK